MGSRCGFAAMRWHGGLSGLAAGYDGFILDLWGTVHDGQRPFPGVMAALRALRRSGRPVVFLSNVPGPVDRVHDSLERLGIGRDLYDHAHSSGEETRDCLARRPDAWYRSLGRRCLYLGPDRHAGLLSADPDLRRVDDPGGADFILCTGLAEERGWWRPEDHHDLLAAAAARRLPLVCANPDLAVPVAGGGVAPCAGAVAACYATTFGGAVRYHGKPDPACFHHCRDLAGLTAESRLLMIGDNLHTDIAGARAAGMDSLLLTSGVHAAELGCAFGEPAAPDRLAALCDRHRIMPDHVAPALRWQTDRDLV